MLAVPRTDRGPAMLASQAAARAVLLGCALAFGALPRPAFAQFNFFQQSEASPQDVYDSIADHGFRLAGPLVRNGNVYVADVIDRGQRRERLIISSRNARIVQRFFVDVGSPRRGPYAYDPAPARTARNSDETDNFFSRLTRGWGDDTPPRPPGSIDNGSPVEVLTPRPAPKKVVRPKSTDIDPRLATRRDDAPISAAPLPAPGPQPIAPVQTIVPTAPQTSPAPPATASVSPPPTPTPAPSAPASSNTRPVVVVTDPLRIPGERPRDPVKPAAETAAAAPIKPAPAPKPVVKPADDVPVAPLD